MCNPTSTLNTLRTMNAQTISQSLITHYSDGPYTKKQAGVFGVFA